VAGLDPQLALGPHLTADDRTAHAVGELDSPVAVEREPRPQGQAAPATRGLQLRAQGAGGRPLGPLLRPLGRTCGHIPRMHPGDVLVGRAHAKPVSLPFENLQRLAVQCFAHPGGVEPGVAEQGRERRRDDGRSVDRAVGEEAYGFGEPRIACKFAQRILRRGARRDSRQARGLDGHLEHTEPPIGHPLAPDVVDGALELLGLMHVAPSARPPSALPGPPRLRLAASTPLARPRYSPRTRRRRRTASRTA